MAIFRNGNHAEDRVCTLLERAEFRIRRTESLDHKHKIDFVVSELPGGIFVPQFGVQITTRRDDLNKMREFVGAPPPNGVARKLYVEMDPSVDLESGGATALIGIILNFQLNAAFALVKKCGVTILPDNSYNFFNVEKKALEMPAPATSAPTATVSASQPSPGPLPPLPQPVGVPVAVHAAASQMKEKWQGTAPAPPAPNPGARPPAIKQPDVSGFIGLYDRPQGWGFIMNPAGQWYFHARSVEDAELKAYLDGLSSIRHLGIDLPVIFDDGGQTNPQIPRKTAFNVRLVK